VVNDNFGTVTILIVERIIVLNIKFITEPL
jgi:hypothetical protein